VWELTTGNQKTAEIMNRLLILIILSIAAPLTASEINHTIQIGSEEQLFLDDYLIERLENIARCINPAAKHPAGPVLKPDKGWEENLALLFGRVIYDDEVHIFKMWYYCDGGQLAYATSKDGIHWEKPELDAVIIGGQKTNLVIERGKMGHLYENFGVIKDKNDPDPTRRYKAGFVSIQRDYRGENEDAFHKMQRRGLGVAVSSDGLHFTLENDFASDAISDISHFFWDSLIDKYVIYGRTKLTPDQLNERWKIWGWGRAVTRIESSDFRTWTQGELVMAADGDDPVGTEIYSMSVFPYQGLYIGCVQMFYGLEQQGNLNIQLAVSRDGRHFSRVQPRDPFIAEGSVASWDRFNIAIGDLPPVEVDDELWFYYSGRSYRHSPYNGKDSGPKTGAIGLAKIKRGRFLALEASFDGGRVTTKPLLFTGTNLFINGNVDYGSIEVSLLDESGKPISRFQSSVSSENGIDIPVRFGGKDLADLAGRPIKIQFKLSNARLFGFCIK